ncbi:hypothetical protein BH18ACT15_BH18ACT15_04000 [soil metagenome]
MEIEQEVGSYVSRELLEEEEGNLPADTVLTNGLLDSWAMMQLVFFLEETYDLTIEMEELIDEHFESIGTVASFVRRKQSASAG